MVNRDYYNYYLSCALVSLLLFIYLHNGSIVSACVLFCPSNKSSLLPPLQPSSSSSSKFMTNLFSKTEGNLFCGELFGMNMLLSPSLAVFPVVVLLFEEPELTISSDETPTRYFSSGLLTCLFFIMIYRCFSISFTRVHTKTS